MIIAIAMVCFAITLPTFFEWQIVEGDQDEEMFGIEVIQTELGLNPVYRAIYYWISVLGFVFIPLTILTIFNLFLIHSVQRSGRKRRQWIDREHTLTSSSRMTTATTSIYSADGGGSLRSIGAKLSAKFVAPAVTRDPVSDPGGYLRNSESLHLKQQQQPNRRYRVLMRQDAHITRLLIAVVLFFITCQLPSAAVIIYIACYPETSVSSEEAVNRNLIVQTLGNLFNLLVSVNSAGNFVLYCLLSRKYRQTLAELFDCGRRRRRPGICA